MVEPSSHDMGLPHAPVPDEPVPDPPLFRATSDIPARASRTISVLRRLASIQKIEENAESERVQRVRELQKAKAGKSLKTGRTGSRELDEYIDNVAAQSPWRGRVCALVTSAAFDAVVGVVIICNAITIGLEAELNVPGHRPATCVSANCDTMRSVVAVLEHLFLALYTVELLLRAVAFGPINALRQSDWVKFDAILVAIGLGEVLVNLAMAESSDALPNITLIRILRLARLARTVRLIIQFRTLWLLVKGLMGSILTMVWTFFLMGTIIFVFAVLAIELIPNNTENMHDPAYNEVATTWFSSVFSASLTLCQMMTMDSSGSIYRPLAEKDPWLMLYFIVYLLIVGIALMNLVTAVMVDTSIQQAQEDRQVQEAWEAQKRAALVPKLREMFTALDVDGSGELDWEELEMAPANVQDMLFRIVNTKDLRWVFETIDYDGSGTISVDEFCEGVLKMQDEKNPDLQRIVKQCQELLRRTGRLSAVIEGVQCSRLGTGMTPAASGISVAPAAAQEKVIEQSLEPRLTSIETRLDQFGSDLEQIMEEMRLWRFGETGTSFAKSEATPL
mmetsp:Transcript_68934/g.183644  ORF Transcript_68934/g.183644 Transcript_68934/m.183644 type:complete len:563 (+) Transcript_68934:12-1700(+)